MYDDVVVKVENISKTYKLYNKPINRLKEALHPLKKNYHINFPALRGVSFGLERGHTLGVIGRNGNGKSTLLKIIAGVLTPTEGRVTTRGKIAAILELTSSLKPEMTGLENIEFNLKVNGIRDSSIKNKTDEIIEFTELGDFLRQPIKTYSSGMKSRLGFAIATSIDPDILILDEVLAVGDFVFQQKCLSKINEMREQMSVIFVSHSMSNVRLFCDQVIVLNEGCVEFKGEPEQAIKYYLEQEQNPKLEIGKKESQKKTIRPFYGSLFHNKQKIYDIVHCWVNGRGKKIATANTGDAIGIMVQFKLSYVPNNLIVGLPIWTSDGEYITGMATDMDKVNIEKSHNDIYRVTFKFNNILNPGQYFNIVAIHDGAEFLYRGLNDHINVKNSDTRYYGYVSIEHSWEIG